MSEMSAVWLRKLECAFADVLRDPSHANLQAGRAVMAAMNDAYAVEAVEMDDPQMAALFKMDAQVWADEVEAASEMGEAVERS